MNEFCIGDSVLCHSLGSWVDGKKGIVINLFIQSSDGINGHLIQMDHGVTVLPPYCLTKVE